MASIFNKGGLPVMRVKRKDLNIVTDFTTYKLKVKKFGKVTQKRFYF